VSWAPLAGSDPVPGDPAALRAAATRAVDVAEALSAAGGRVKAAQPGSPWTGLAAQRFAEERRALPTALDALARRCHQTAEALRAYAPRLEAAQELARQALWRARAAVDDIAAARRGIDAMRAHGRAAADAAARWNAANPDAPPRHPAPWTGPDWPARLVAAQAELEAARRLLRRAEADRDTAAASAAAALHAAAGGRALLDRLLGGVLGGLPPFLRQLVRSGGAAELSFVVTPDGLVLNTQEGWQWEALRLAGIDPASWDPSKGLDRIDAEAQAAWELYATLYEMNPDQFLWAGMAKLAGGTFYAGFQDINVLRRALEEGALTAEQVRELLRTWFPGLPGPALEPLLAAASGGAGVLAGELRFVEQTLLEMQRNIFDDLAWQHLAYTHGGMAAMRDLAARGEIGNVHLAAWRDIDSGDPDRIRAGNARLLRHEQEHIIGQDYDAIRDRSIVTWALTMGMSIIAESPVSGGRPFREVVPYTVGASISLPERIPIVPDQLIPDRVPFTDLPVPGGGGISIPGPGTVGVSVDLPLHNVSIFENRWEWIETDMVPAYLDLVDTGVAPGIIATPIEELAEDRRLVPLPYTPR
jgi:uncharacterized protein YukE